VPLKRLMNASIPHAIRNHHAVPATNIHAAEIPGYFYNSM
jgi:hypothetical protein